MIIQNNFTNRSDFHLHSLPLNSIYEEAFLQVADAIEAHINEHGHRTIVLYRILQLWMYVEQIRYIAALYAEHQLKLNYVQSIKTNQDGIDNFDNHFFLNIGNV